MHPHIYKPISCDVKGISRATETKLAYNMQLLGHTLAHPVVILCDLTLSS